jgi:membrane-bound acyltransferase YfiQ involved in biofilm formation
MGTRTAIRQNPFVAFGLMFVMGWVILVGLGVVAGASPPQYGDWVGRHGVGAVVGLVVLAAFLAMTVAVLGEQGETDPTPREWPPE